MIRLILIVLFFLSFHCNTAAQKVLHENSYNLGGGVSFSISKNDHATFNSRTTSFIFNPSVTYHLYDVFTIGGNLLFKYEDDTIESASGNQHSVDRIFEFGPTFRYYFHSDNFAPFIDCAFNYSVVLPAKTHGLGFNLGTGINYFFTKSIAVEPKVSIAFNNYSNPRYDSMSFRFGISFNYHINEN